MHEKWMSIAIDQAKQAMGLTSPNPIVGAVIVKDDVLLGKGYHKKAGQPHAEREAIADALANHPAEALKGSIIYVTLEPCSTHGKTPPCTQGIIDAGISHVVYGSTDANPSHAGAADKMLTELGISVTSGILEQECDKLTRDFAKRITTGKPWVIAKTAMSLDGRITRPQGESQWLTSAASRELVHQLRATVDAIIIGGRTLRNDNPRLTLRGENIPEEKVQPYRVVLSKTKDLPQAYHLFTDEHKERTLVYTDKSFEQVLEELANLGCNKVLLECGGGLMAQWFEQDLVDECYFFYAPMICGGTDQAISEHKRDQSIQFKEIHYQQIDNDMLVHGVVESTNTPGP